MSKATQQEETTEYPISVKESDHFYACLTGVSFDGSLIPEQRDDHGRICGITPTESAPTFKIQVVTALSTYDENGEVVKDRTDDDCIINLIVVIGRGVDKRKFFLEDRYESIPEAEVQKFAVIVGNDHAPEGVAYWGPAYYSEMMPTPARMLQDAMWDYRDESGQQEHAVAGRYVSEIAKAWAEFAAGKSNEEIEEAVLESQYEEIEFAGADDEEDDDEE